MCLFSQTGSLPAPSAAGLFSLMQDTAAASAEALGAGRAALLEKNLAWVILRSSLRLSRPLCGKIRIETYTGRARLGLCPRYFRLFDKDELAGEATTLWTLLDLTSRRAVPADFPEVLPPPGVRPALRIPAYPQPIEGEERVCEHSFSEKDVDQNGHINNAAYLRALEAAIPGAIAALDVVYQKEILPGKPAQAHWICREKDFFFRIFSENEAHFSASGTLF